MPIDLYYMDVSAPCRSVIMTAKVLGVDLNLKVLNLMTGEHMTPEFLKINPQHNIPTIDDDGFYLNESRAICAYLVNQYGKDDKLYPKDPKIRARVDQRLYFDMGVFYHRFGQLYYPVMMQGATKLEGKAQKDLAEAVNYLETFLGQSEYAACDHLTIADLALLASATTFQAVDSTVFENHPKIQAWLDKCKADVPEHGEVDQKGADAFGEWARSALSKLSQ